MRAAKSKIYQLVDHRWPPPHTSEAGVGSRPTIAAQTSRQGKWRVERGAGETTTRLTAETPRPDIFPLREAPDRAPVERKRALDSFSQFSATPPATRNPGLTSESRKPHAPDVQFIPTRFLFHPRKILRSP
jgi:hypothetical protein